MAHFALRGHDRFMAAFTRSATVKAVSSGPRLILVAQRNVSEMACSGPCSSTSISMQADHSPLKAPSIQFACNSQMSVAKQLIGTCKSHISTIYIFFRPCNGRIHLRLGSWRL